MSRRTKLIIIAIFLVMIGIPTWHVASNWAPADPLQFRLVSRLSLPDQEDEDSRSERVEIEVLNTSTAPRYLENAQLRWCSDTPHTQFKVYTYLVDAHLETGPVIPAGGTWRGTGHLALPMSGSDDSGSVEVTYTHASTTRQQVLTWYASFCFHHLSAAQQLRFWIRTCGISRTTLERYP